MLYTFITKIVLTENNVTTIAVHSNIAAIVLNYNITCYSDKAFKIT